ncbi:hypothetical protein IEQ34_012792 [Dendrobium chrysotoxum]|uniref:Pentatricopeptide repeat-containing protein n=1 Tax=Dendrobium chrysotoxum TaxID=161865 RepID=A0AAV7GN87_DENCH|nr:hypothetical protein IEQ34_012792 [Dendrobium chrysotoxum]
MALPCTSINPISNQHKWNTIIKRKLLAGDFEGCITAHNEMQEAGHFPNNFAFPLLLKAAAFLLSPSLGSALHGQALKTGYCSHLFVQTSMINMYSRLGSINDARKVFDIMPHRDTMAWNAILSAYASDGRADMCLELFSSMPVKDLFSFNIMISAFATAGRVEYARQIFDSSSYKDDFSWNSLISCYVKAGDMHMALTMFDQMPEKNAVSWNIIISGYLQNEQYVKVIEKFFEMKSSGFTSSELAMASTIAASAHLGSLRLGTELHLHAYELGLTLSPNVAAAVIDMYAKCGSTDGALIMFYKTQTKDIYVWNSVICGLAAHGFGVFLFKLFEDMKQFGVMPDEITFIGLLVGCSHSGMITEGYQLFNSMVEKYGVSPNLEHYACVVDLLSRAGELRRAHGIVKEMPFKPGASVLGALLNGCLIHRNVELGMEAMKLITERRDAMSDGEYMMMANMCAVAGYHEEATRWRDKMRENGVIKKAGFSMIEVDGKQYRFQSGDVKNSSLFY